MSVPASMRAAQSANVVHFFTVAGDAVDLLGVAMPSSPAWSTASAEIITAS